MVVMTDSVCPKPWTRVIIKCCVRPRGPRRPGCLGPEVYRLIAWAGLENWMCPVVGP